MRRTWVPAVLTVAASAATFAACWPFDAALSDCEQTPRCYGGASSDSGNDGGNPSDSGTDGGDGIDGGGDAGSANDSGSPPDSGSPDSGSGQCVALGDTCADPSVCCDQTQGCNGQCCLQPGAQVTGTATCLNCCSGMCVINHAPGLHGSDAGASVGICQ